MLSIGKCQQLYVVLFSEQDKGTIAPEPIAHHGNAFTNGKGDQCCDSAPVDSHTSGRVDDRG